MNSFFDELNEISKIAYSQNKQSNTEESIITKYPRLSGFAASMPVAIGINSINKRLMEPLLNPPIMEEIEVPQYYKKLEKKLKVNPKLIQQNYPGIGPAFIPHSNSVHIDPHLLRKTPGIAAHELGHVSAAKNKNFLKHLQKPLVRILPAAIGGAAGLGTSLLADPNSTLGKASPYIAGAAMLPMLASEAHASILGYRALKKVAPELARQGLKNMLRGGATYGLATLSGMLAPYAINKFRRMASNKNKQQ